MIVEILQLFTMGMINITPKPRNVSLLIATNAHLSDTLRNTSRFIHILYSCFLPDNLIDCNISQCCPCANVVDLNNQSITIVPITHCLRDMQSSVIVAVRYFHSLFLFE